MTQEIPLTTVERLPVQRFDLPVTQGLTLPIFQAPDPSVKYPVINVPTQEEFDAAVKAEQKKKEEEKEEEIDLNELLASLEEESVEDESVEEVKSQLSEAMKTVEFLKTQLNEVNLLNAKLLYTNKLFKAHALDNNQKMKIIEAFDLTKSVREVKLTYNNLSEAFNLSKVKTAPKKSTIAEGFASNTTGTTKPVQTEKSVIAESVNGQVSRFQKLAGIKK